MWRIGSCGGEGPSGGFAGQFPSAGAMEDGFFQGLDGEGIAGVDGLQRVEPFPIGSSVSATRVCSAIDDGAAAVPSGGSTED